MTPLQQNGEKLVTYNEMSYLLVVELGVTIKKESEDIKQRSLYVESSLLKLGESQFCLDISMHEQKAVSKGFEPILIIPYKWVGTIEYKEANNQYLLLIRLKEEYDPPVTAFLFKSVTYESLFPIHKFLLCSDQVKDIVMFKLQVLRENSELFQIYKSLVIDGGITDKEFWKDRKELIEYERDETTLNQKLGKTQKLFFKFNLEKDQQFNIKLGKTDLEKVLATFPEVQKYFIEQKNKGVTKKDFWDAFWPNQIKFKTEIVGGPNPVFLGEKFAAQDNDKNKIRSFISDDVNLNKNFIDQKNDDENIREAEGPSLKEGQSIIDKINKHSTRVIQLENDFNQKLNMIQENEKILKTNDGLMDHDVVKTTIVDGEVLLDIKVFQNRLKSQLQKDIDPKEIQNQTKAWKIFKKNFEGFSLQEKDQFKIQINTFTNSNKEYSKEIIRQVTSDSKSAIKDKLLLKDIPDEIKCIFGPLNRKVNEVLTYFYKTYSDHEVEALQDKKNKLEGIVRTLDSLEQSRKEEIKKLRDDDKLKNYEFLLVKLGERIKRARDRQDYFLRKQKTDTNEITNIN